MISGSSRLVDQDVVDLVDDRVEVPALDAAGEVDHEVVAQVVEAELVVRPVRDVGGVRLGPRDRPQVAQPLVGGREVRVEQEGAVVLDRPDAHAEPMEHRADPLRVALGEVVVDGHDVHAASDEGVEIGRQRADEGLALARALLGDHPAVQDDAAHQLDVVVPLAERPDHGLADRGEGLRQELLERRVDLLQLALALLLQLVGEAGGIGAGQRRVGGVLLGAVGAQLDRHQDVADALAKSFAKHGGTAAELVIGESLDLRLERVDALDERLESSDLPLVGVPQAGQELEHRACEYRPRRPKPLEGALTW